MRHDLPPFLRPLPHSLERRNPPFLPYHPSVPCPLSRSLPQSSLLTAIILALGGEPKKITSGENKGRAGGGGEVAARWDNVIRWGCDTCTVEVDLLNKGQEAIERETWGDVVT